MRAPPLADEESRVFAADEVNQRARLMGVIPSAYATSLTALPRGLNYAYSAPIIFAFVVDTSGHVEQPTFHVVKTPDTGLAAAIEQTLREAPYRPAERNGHRVRQLVQDTLYAVIRH